MDRRLEIWQNEAKITNVFNGRPRAKDRIWSRREMAERSSQTGETGHPSEVSRAASQDGKIIDCSSKLFFTDLELACWTSTSTWVGDRALG